MACTQDGARTTPKVPRRRPARPRMGSRLRSSSRAPAARVELSYAFVLHAVNLRLGSERFTLALLFPGGLTETETWEPTRFGTMLA